jgi:hypothetical protein
MKKRDVPICATSIQSMMPLKSREPMHQKKKLASAETEEQRRRNAAGGEIAERLIREDEERKRKKALKESATLVTKAADQKSLKPTLNRGSRAALKRTDSVKSATGDYQTVLKEWLQTKPPSQGTAIPNSIGLAIGQSASQELRNFISVFESMASETADGDMLSNEGFLSADLNGASEVLFSYVCCSQQLYFG